MRWEILSEKDKDIVKTLLKNRGIKNEKEFLLTRAKELSQEDLSKLREMAKEKIEEKKEEDDKEIRDKHWVK